MASLRRFALAAAALALGLAIWGLGIEPRRLVVVEAALTLPRWPGEARVALLSDLHVGGPAMPPARVAALVAAANATRPDLVLLLGDFAINGLVGGRAPAVSDWTPALAGLQAPAFAVMGNHDWWNDVVAIRAGMEAAGVTVLENEHRRLSLGGGTVYLAGIGDEMTRHDDTDTALSGIPEGAAVLAMTHGPDLFDEAPDRIDLLVAGHTHGGQVSLPVFGPPLLPSRFGQRYARGHIVEEGRQLYVTSGVGCSILPLRLGVPPELALLTLRGP